MIDISDLLEDEDLCQTFQILRPGVGGFVNEGEYQTAPETALDRSGSIQPAKAADILQFLPEGERSGDIIAIWSSEEIRKGDGAGIPSDVVIWDGRKYRVAFAKPWKAYGYWFAMAVNFQ